MHKPIIFLALIFISIGNLSANALSKAQNLFADGDYDQAMTSVDAHLKVQPKSAEARFLKGLILVEQGDTTSAIDVFTALTKDYPELPEPYNNIAVIYASEGDYDSARLALQAALKTHPSYATAYENLGDIYAKLASEAYQQALDLEKRDPDKLKVKLSLISNLFSGDSKPVSVATAQPVVERRPVTQAKPAKVEKAPVQQIVAKVENRAVVVKSKKPSNKTGSGKAMVEQAEQLKQTINLWAASWSARDVDAYLSFYADSFRPAIGTAAKWRAQRRIRLRKPEYIHIELENMNLTNIAENTATIEFVQKYESNTYKDRARKRLDLVLRNGQWKIKREVSI